MFRQKYGVAVLINGLARGVDTFAREWALDRGVPVEDYPAEWDKHAPPEGSGRKNPAGAIRNTQMRVEGKPDVLLSFPGQEGTKNMTEQCIKNGIWTIRIDKVGKVQVDNDPRNRLEIFK